MQVRALIVLCFLLSISLNALIVPYSSEPIRSEENMFTDLVRVDPDDSKAETLQTRFWLWQDGDFLVLHVEAEIDSSFEKGNRSRRDEGGGGDYLRIQLVTMPNAYMAYYYLFYPMGNIIDGVREKDMGVDYSWDSTYSYESSWDESIWRVTARIPLGELRFRQEFPYQWRVILSRYNYSSRSTYSSPYANTKAKTGYFMMSNPISLNRQISKKSSIILKPYFVKSYDLITHTDSFDPQNLGVDMVYSPSQRVRVKVSVNPDFSDVPMDNAQDNYNSKYPPYYSENRFFFTEDLQVFGLEDYFYTRNIVQPQLAYKVTGNSGRVNWGLLGAFDKEIKDEGEIINSNDYYQVISVNPGWEKFSLNNSLISRVNKGFYNHAYFGKANHRMTENLFWAAQILAATEKDETEEHNGFLGNTTLGWEPGDFSSYLSYSITSKDLRHSAGYLTETDNDGLGLNLNWDQQSPESFISSKGLNASVTAGRTSLSLDEPDAFSAYLFGSMFIKQKLYLHSTISRGTDLDNNLKAHWVSSFSAGFNYTPIPQVSFGVQNQYRDALIYALGEVYHLDSWIFSLNLRLARKMRFYVMGRTNVYDYPRVNTITLPGGIEIPLVLDDKYGIYNFTLNYSHSNTISLSGGLGLSTYESGGRYADLSYYGNLAWEFKTGNFFYMGFKSRQSQMEPGNFSNLLPHYRRDLATAYLKLAFTL